MVNMGKYTMHGFYGHDEREVLPFRFQWSQQESPKQKHCCCTFQCGKSNIWTQPLQFQNHPGRNPNSWHFIKYIYIYSCKEKMSNFTSDINHQRHPLTLILPTFGHRSCAGFTSGLVGSTWTWPSWWKKSPKTTKNSDAWKRQMSNSIFVIWGNCWKVYINGKSEILRESSDSFGWSSWEQSHVVFSVKSIDKKSCGFFSMYFWLVVSTHLKHIS